MGRRALPIVAMFGLATALGGCNPVGYPSCYRVECPYPPVYHNSYSGYEPGYISPGRAAYSDPPFENPFDDYTQRSLTISPGAGNAQSANTTLQTATPWPRYSNDTNIPGNGARMVKAVHDFEAGSRPALDTSGGATGQTGASPGAAAGISQ